MAFAANEIISQSLGGSDVRSFCYFFVVVLYLLFLVETILYSFTVCCLHLCTIWESDTL